MCQYSLLLLLFSPQTETSPTHVEPTKKLSDAGDDWEDNSASLSMGDTSKNKAQNKVSLLQEMKVRLGEQVGGNTLMFQSVKRVR